ncbi:MAG: replication endonuclease [Saccharospirillum sp.]|uniref:replication endonuclease n=1 Tax=Saccharospirillum sp. TaxID=2033801 RepID=UPI003297632C
MGTSLIGVTSIKLMAVFFARLVTRRLKQADTPTEVLQQATRLADYLNLTAPTPNQGRTAVGCASRLSESAWWRRHLERHYRQAIDNSHRALGQVRHGTSPYLAKPIFNEYLHAQELSQAYLARTFIESEDGERLSLAEVSEHTVSNPAVRRAELMTRVRGMEEYAQAHDCAGLFITLTLPSEFHASLKKGFVNPRHDGSDPRAGNDHLGKLWSLIRAKVHRNDITPFGLRVVEPHHDGTPHWHLMLFTPKGSEQSLVSIFREYVLKDSERPDLLKRRLKIVHIDPARGSAAGYVAKYVSKNIDGANLKTDQAGRPLLDTPTRIRAWASTWRIRQFQTIGGPPVGVWRELRRLREGRGYAMGAAYEAADTGDWFGFMEAMQHKQLCGEGRGVELMRAHTETVNRVTGEVVTSYTNRFGEPLRGKVIGVCSGILRLPTRTRHWLGQQFEPLKVIGLAGVAGNPVTFSGNLDLCK